jgi:hypothetical protein
LVAKAKQKMASCKVHKPISQAFTYLDIKQIESHFKKDNADPFFVCEIDSVEEFNAYFGKEKEKLAIPLRFIELRGKDLYIVDWKSDIHEFVIHEFECEFLDRLGNRNYIKKNGSFTAERHGFQNKEADTSFGPLKGTPNLNNPPQGIGMRNWITLAVEISIFQSWPSLERAAQWWAFYPGIEYIVCIKVSKKGQSWSYRLYSIAQVGILPEPMIDRKFRGRILPNVEIITLDARRLLGIPQNLALPADINAQVVIDMLPICTMVRNSIAD